MRSEDGRAESPPLDGHDRHEPTSTPSSVYGNTFIQHLSRVGGMRNELPEGLVLDEAESPDGPLELVAYQEKGTVWIGVKAKGSAMEDAIGLHTGSGEHYVEATASIHHTWGVWLTEPSHRRSNALRSGMSEVKRSRAGSFRYPRPFTRSTELPGVWQPAADRTAL
jgi:hypothetical protein